MKKTNHILLFVVLMLMVLGLFACQRKTNNTTSSQNTTTKEVVTTTEPEVTTTEPEVTTTEPEVTTTEDPGTTTEDPGTTTLEQLTGIQTILSTFKNNDDLLTQGVVYAISSNGFYISDSDLGNIFVIKPASGDMPVIGDDVKIKGKFAYVNNMPQIKAVSEMTVLTQENATMTFAESTIPTVNALSSTDRVGSYAKAVKLVGTLYLDPTGMYGLRDEEGNTLYFEDYSDKARLEAKVNTRVSAEVVLYKYLTSDEKWTVTLGFGSALEDAPLEFSDLVNRAKAYIAETVATV